MSEILFYIIIFLANIIQGITGFAGTILAMPFSIPVVGYETAKPVLNVLGIIAGIYVVVGDYRKVNVMQLKKICACMGIGIIVGIRVKNLLKGQQALLYALLGIFVLAIGIKGLAESIGARKEKSAYAGSGRFLLLLAGIVHGMFVCGGPLVVGYLSGCTKNKEEFRRTISAVWIILNTMILISDVLSGCYTVDTIRIQTVSVLFLFGGMFAGSVLYKHMSQRVFMVLTYILLCISGVSLLIKN